MSSRIALSPSVSVREFDLTTTVPAIATTITGTCGRFNWGPCFERKKSTNEREMVDHWGAPDNNNFKDWFSCNEFLRYSQNLWVVRAVDTDTAKNAGIAVQDEDQAQATAALSTNPYIPNKDNIPTLSFDTNEKIKILAKYPGGTYGNNKIRIALAIPDDWDTAEILDGVTFKSEFEYAPQAGAYNYLDEIAIAVLVQNTLDEQWDIKEKWIVSFDSTAKDGYNQSTYIETVINEKSLWIWAYNNTSLEKGVQSFEATYFSGGVDGAPDTGDIQTGYDLFEVPEEFDVNILIDGANNNETIGGYIVDISDARKDCISYLTVPSTTIFDVDVSTAINNCVTYRTTTLNKNSSYGALFANWKEIYDKYNEINRWIPVSGDMAGITARSDNLSEPWFAPAGLTRGQMRNVIRLKINPKRTYRDDLYKNSINPVVSLPGRGTMLFGQKTLLFAASAFDRINVRRLFIILEKSIATFAETKLFEINDVFTRNLFKLQVEPFLRSVQSRRGIYDFHVICDETNNTGDVIDNNEFIADIYIKPARAIEFIQLNFFATPTGVDFDEIIRPNATL